MRRPEARYAAAPLYSDIWQQAAHRLMVRPVSWRFFFRQRQWREYPSWDFLLCLGLIAVGTLSFILGTLGIFARGGWLEMTTQTHIPVLANDLVSYEAADIRSLFGTPSLIRREPPAQIWQYRQQDCVLDIYLYEDHRREKVQHAEIRAHASTHAASSAGNSDFERECVRTFRLATLN